MRSQEVAATRSTIGNNFCHLLRRKIRSAHSAAFVNVGRRDKKGLKLALSLYSSRIYFSLFLRRCLDSTSNFIVLFVLRSGTRIVMILWSLTDQLLCFLPLHGSWKSWEVDYIRKAWARRAICHLNRAERFREFTRTGEPACEAFRLIAQGYCLDNALARITLPPLARPTPPRLIVVIEALFADSRYRHARRFRGRRAVGLRPFCIR